MAEATAASGKMRVKQVYTYPIKSIRGISLPCLSATYTGFPHDRRFMLFDVKQGKNMHIAYHVEMCLFTTAFDDATTPKEVIVTYTKDHVFDHPEQKVSREALHVSLDPATEGLDEVEVTMHSSPVIGYDMGEKYDAWFSERFGYEVKLLYIGGNSRKVLGNMPPHVAAEQQSGSSGSSGSSWLGNITSTATSLLRSVTGGGYEGVDQGISFADVAPYLVISTKSWENAQRRLDGSGEVMDISKFRPNIIVEGAEEDFEEDFWAELEIGDAGAKIVLTQNCARCNSLNVDYNTGKVSEGESGKILKKLQSDRRVDPGAKWSPVFGRYGFLARIPEGKEAPAIKVGDEVRVVKRNKERTRFEWPNLSTS
ncbi:hypothetical protein G647_04728 [Cladophialophora carrionii CBS 160.54]|uniref:MOSC domain-containing protein n=1 Tax=Cladophialophora carrionii CBS 160.54 TaxID=1279043 RepID=V9D7P8_9EURO|nr:uncharacterized protein G647_04728 [Cladophialophora carrionii CBS 160.54]ETI22934.1 hypothetical protein G647_04728 [Cladophialophora carrionii CBS 160.54]